MLIPRGKCSTAIETHGFSFFFCAWKLLLAAILAWLVTGQIMAAPPPGYYLVWSDEFDGTSLNPANWWVLGPTRS